MDIEVNLPEDTVASGFNVVSLTQGKHVVRISVVEVSMLGFGPVPLDLIPEDGPVEVLGEEVNEIFIVDVCSVYARTEREATLSLLDYHHWSRRAARCCNFEGDIALTDLHLIAPNIFL